MGGKINRRDAMVFPFRWIDSLRELEDAGERWAFVEAAAAYAASGELPAFRGAMAALWKEFATRLDYDRDKYAAICERNRRNGMKGGRPPKTPANPMGPEKADGDGDGDGEGDGYIKVSRDTFSPKPENSGGSGTPKPENIFFDYEGDARIHGVTPAQLALWEESFPGIDVREEIRMATVWLDGNRRQRKRDVRRFLANWLMRAQEKSRPGRKASAPDVFLERERSWSDAERGVR